MGTHDTAEQPARLDVLKLITSIGSPIALATALLFYFGWVRSEAQARAFGADASVFQMSTQDYVLRSVNVLFFPIILLLLLALLAIRVDKMLRKPARKPAWLPTFARILRFSWLFFLALGILLYAVAGRLGDVTLPLWVALAILGPTYGALLRRDVRAEGTTFSPVTVGLLVTLVTVLLFWQTERVARLGGEALAQDIQDNMGDRLNAVDVYSVKDLQLAGPGVAETRIAGGADTAYGFSYSGLYLLQRSGDAYFLVTDGWDADEARLVVLPDNASIRVEFGP